MKHENDLMYSHLNTGLKTKGYIKSKCTYIIKNWHNILPITNYELKKNSLQLDFYTFIGLNSYDY